MKWLSLCVVILIEFTIPVYSQFNLISKPLDPYLIGHSSFNIKEIQLRDRNYLVLLSGLIEKKLKVSEEYFIMDSIISVNTSGGIGKHIFSYYPNFKLFENIWLIKTNNSWYETMKTEYFYDEEGNKYRDLYFDNNSFVWDTSLQINSNYNLLGNLDYINYVQIFSLFHFSLRTI